MWSSSGAVIYVHHIYGESHNKRDVYQWKAPKNHFIAQNNDETLNRKSRKEFRIRNRDGKKKLWQRNAGRVVGQITAKWWDTGTAAQNATRLCATFAIHWICATFALHFCTTLKLQTAIFVQVQGKERLHFTEKLLDLEQSLSCWTSVLEILTVEVTGENILPVCCIAEPFVQAPIPPPWWVGSKSPPGPLSSEKRRL